MPPATEGVRGASRPKPSVKALNQVIVALKTNKGGKGPTLHEIVKFISRSLNEPATKRQILTALKRSMEFGLIKCNRGRYVIFSNEGKIQKPKAIQAPRKTRGPRKLVDRSRKAERVKVRRTRSSPANSGLSALSD